MKKNNNLPNKRPDSFYRYTTIATKMIVIILLFTFGGRELDAWLELDFPAFLLTGSILGVTLAIYSVIRDLLK